MPARGWAGPHSITAPRPISSVMPRIPGVAPTCSTTRSWSSCAGGCFADMPDHRAHFDFEIRFANGGDLTGTGFRLDLPSADLDEASIGRLLVEHLGLALVDTVELRRL